MKKTTYIMGLCVAIFLVGCSGTSGDLIDTLNGITTPTTADTTETTTPSTTYLTETETITPPTSTIENIIEGTASSTTENATETPLVTYPTTTYPTYTNDDEDSENDNDDNDDDNDDNDDNNNDDENDDNDDNDENNNDDENDDNEGTSSTSIENHNQGRACAECHSSGENQFASGATVYSNATTFANGYTIRLVKSDGSLASYLDGRGTGNSHLFTFSGTTFTAKVVDASGNIVNSSATNSHDSSRLDCNRCHTQAGLNNAPGRILTTQTVATIPSVVVTPPATTTPAVVTTPLAKSFSTDVMPVLEAKCKSCHGSSGNFSVTTASATHTNLTSNGFLDTATPANSKLLQRATGNSHGGGVVISTTSAEYTTLKAWITEGALNN